MPCWGLHGSDALLRLVSGRFRGLPRSCLAFKLPCHITLPPPLALDTLAFAQELNLALGEDMLQRGHPLLGFSGCLFGDTPSLSMMASGAAAHD